jgi:hypothetical protein
MISSQIDNFLALYQLKLPSKEEQARIEDFLTKNNVTDPNIKSVLLRYATQTPHEFPDIKYMKGNDIWKDGVIPLRVGSDEKPDFTLLTGKIFFAHKVFNITGDIGDPNTETVVVTDILNDIEAKYVEEFPNLNVIIGPSGCGKTKAQQDIQRKKYGMYLDFSSERESISKEFTQMLINMPEKYFLDSTAGDVCNKLVGYCLF